MRTEKEILIFQAFSKYSFLNFIKSQQKTAKGVISELKLFDSDRNYDPAGVKDME